MYSNIKETMEQEAVKVPMRAAPKGRAPRNFDGDRRYSMTQKSRLPPKRSARRPQGKARAVKRRPYAAEYGRTIFDYGQTSDVSLANTCSSGTSTRQYAEYWENQAGQLMDEFENVHIQEHPDIHEAHLLAIAEQARNRRLECATRYVTRPYCST
jgi:hypothetical protein